MQKECCAKFNPKKWNNKTFVWKNKPFIMESIPQIFHIPFFPMIGKKITKMYSLATDSKQVIPKKDENLILFQDPSAFKSNIYFSVKGNVPKANNVKLSGTFFARVYDGDYNAIPRFVKDMNEHLKKQGKKVPCDGDYFIHYAYCPKCAKEYGNNYMILFAKLSN